MSAKSKNQEVALRKRIHEFYRALNRHDFERCHEMIDPRVRAKASSVTLLQYSNSLREFLAAAGEIRVEKIDLVLHVNEPTALYENRDFAIGETSWKDEDGKPRTFSERWVREGRSWYTRNTGFIVPKDTTVKPGPARSERTRVVTLD